jgi:7-cyano-7-deazaguanine synthase
MENAAATRFCEERGIKRIVLDVPIGQIGGCSLVDHSLSVTTDMNQQRSTVVPMRNSIFLTLAAAVAIVNNCDVITHGACREDEAAYRDCRSPFFHYMQMAIQAGLTDPKRGSENIEKDVYEGVISDFNFDIKIETPLISESKATTMARILKKYPVSVYKNSYSCYNGGEKQCGNCPACQERKAAFVANNVEDPVGYDESTPKLSFLKGAK